MQLTTFLMKEPLPPFKAGMGGGDSSFTGDSQLCGDFYKLQSTCQALSCSVSVSTETVLNIVGQHDQLAQSSPQWMLLKQRQEGEPGVRRGGCVLCLWLCLSVSAVPVLPDPRCQLLSFQNLGADLRRYRVAGLSHAPPLGDGGPRLSPSLNTPAAFSTVLSNPASTTTGHDRLIVAGDTARFVIDLIPNNHRVKLRFLYLKVFTVDYLPKYWTDGEIENTCLHISTIFTLLKHKSS